MAKSQELEKRVESDSESAEDDEDVDSSSSEDGSGSSESDSETGETQAKKSSSSLPPPAVKKSQPQPSAVNLGSSTDDEESETESDEPGVGGVKPVASKPIDQKSGGDGRNPRSKNSVSDSVKSAGAKRSGSAVEKEAEVKRSKKEQQQVVANVENSEKKSNEDSKKQLFQRLWSEGDEIVILKGMMEYTEKKKADPIADLKAFHDFIKADLHVEVTRAQLQAKIRRLKKKFENNKSKEKDGKERVFSKSHEQKAYELSKLVWGNENVKPRRRGEKMVGSPKGSGKSGRKTQNKKGNNETNNAETGNPTEAEAVNGSKDKGICFSNVMMNVEESIMRSGEELFEGNKKFEGEEEWRKLRILEMEVYLKKLDLMRAQTKLVLDVLKNSEQ